MVANLGHASSQDIYILMGLLAQSPAAHHIGTSRVPIDLRDLSPKALRALLIAL
jgi:hypothetical protein